MEQVTPEYVQGILINPFYAIQVAPELVETHEPSIHDEEWITGNSSLLEKIGAEQWLLSLLDVLQGNTLHELVNPYHAITIDPMFAVEHPPVWSKEQWIQGNVMLLPQPGTEKWLRPINSRAIIRRPKEQRTNAIQCSLLSGYGATLEHCTIVPSDGYCLDCKCFWYIQHFFLGE